MVLAGRGRYQQTIQYSVEGVLYDATGTNTQDQGTAGPYTVPAGKTVSGASLTNLDYSHSTFGVTDYTNGPVNFTWNIANVQQTAERLRSRQITSPGGGSPSCRQGRCNLAWRIAVAAPAGWRAHGTAAGPPGSLRTGILRSN